MNRLILGLLCGASAGAVLTYMLLGPDAAVAPAEPIRDIVVVEKMSVAAADEHRQERYTALRTVEQIYALPTGFGRAEALYAVAGREDSAGVQKLIFEANRISDREDRSAALNTLFFRLTELDPHSALALARMNDLRGDRGLERRVWVSWGRRNLDEALAAAEAQSSKTQKSFAAQSLLSGFGLMGNATTDRIARELGIEPDRSTRGRFIYRLADESPARAIAFINSMQQGVKQEEMVSWLAFYLARREPEQAGSYAVLFDNQRYKDNYEQIVDRNVAAANPTEVLDRILTSGRAGLSRSEIYGAMRGVAAGDLDVAMNYYDRLRSAEDKTIMADAIANALAGRDVDAALLWARANETSDMPELEMQVLQNLAQRDLPRAIEEARNAINPQMRNSMLAGIAERDVLSARQMADQLPDGDAKDSAYAQIVQARAASHPREAIAWLDRIGNEAHRGRAASNIVSQWYGNDPEGTQRWVQNLPTGSVRDDAISGLVNQWHHYGIEQEEMIASISDDGKRNQARTRQIYTLMRRDPGRARELMERADLPEYDRQRLEMWIKQMNRN